MAYRARAVARCGLAAAAALTGACVAMPRDVPPEPAPIAFEAVPVCYDYGCRTRTAIALTAADRAALQHGFRPPAADPATERQRIRAAIALLETIAGEQTPVHRDRGGNPWDQAGPGGMDCIDESVNATVFLRLLEQHGLLRWHRVEGRAYRAPLLMDQHFAAQVLDLRSGRRYVVDSWHLDNGRPPYVQPLTDWLQKRPFDEALNPPLAPSPRQ